MVCVIGLTIVARVKLLLARVRNLATSSPHSTPTTMWNNSYGASSSHNAYYAQSPQNQNPNVPLQFYAGTPDQSQFYPGSRSSLEGNVAQGPMAQPSVGVGSGNMAIPSGGWWTAFGTGGFEGEPPLLEGMFLTLALCGNLIRKG